MIVKTFQCTCDASFISAHVRNANIYRCLSWMVLKSAFYSMYLYVFLNDPCTRGSLHCWDIHDHDCSHCFHECMHRRLSCSAVLCRYTSLRPVFHNARLIVDSVPTSHHDNWHVMYLVSIGLLSLFVNVRVLILQHSLTRHHSVTTHHTHISRQLVTITTSASHPYCQRVYSHFRNSHTMEGFVTITSHYFVLYNCKPHFMEWIWFGIWKLGSSQTRQ